jgi:3D (Asp-Asp-Asp) domain-containing protein
LLISSPKTFAPRVVVSALVRGRTQARRATVALMIAGLTAALALPGSGGADPSTQANALRARQASLGSRTHAALLNLYSLDARLTQSRARVAALLVEASQVRAQLKQVAQEQTIARHAWRVSVSSLASHLRTLYEDGQPNAIAVLLGATSIDDAMTRLDELERTERLNRQTIAQTLSARADLARLRGELERRSTQLRTLLASAQQTTAQLEQVRADRTAYIASLAHERTFNRRKIAQLDAQARQSAATAPAPAGAQVASAPVPSTAAATPAPPPSGATLVVTATGYSITGHTATGLQVGWGVVAVDPSVIPLGTRLTIPGYGDGVAADTGGAVRGAVIDLWFPTSAQAMAWGRRTVTITVH